MFALKALTARALGTDTVKLGVLARFADRGGANFAHGGVAGALTGAPHVPTGDGAVRAPAFPEGQ